MRDTDLFTFVGDDFTGSTDVLLQYLSAGMAAVLFLSMPDDEALAAAAEAFPVIGIATVNRSLPATEIAPIVHEAFTRLARLDPAVVQYKICSTVDSSPDIGSIAPAIAAGGELFGAYPVPVLAAQPGMGRYTVFSNHFAADRHGIHRLDRSAMAEHAATPMAEADLRRHIATQIEAEVAAFDIRALATDETAAARMRALTDADTVAVIVDGLTEADLRRAAATLRDGLPRPAFMIGSGGLSAGLAATATEDSAASAPSTIGPAPTTLVVAGSASQHTTDQIDAAAQAGWAIIHLDPADLAGRAFEHTIDEPAGHRPASDTLDAVAARMLQAFDEAPGVLVYTAHRGQGLSKTPVDVTRVGAALAELIMRAHAERGLDRLVVAGGDTSGHVLGALGARTLTATARIAADMALGRIGAPGTALDGLEVILKGGALGPLDLFERARTGVPAGDVPG